MHGKHRPGGGEGCGALSSLMYFSLLRFCVSPSIRIMNSMSVSVSSFGFPPLIEAVDVGQPDDAFPWDSRRKE